MTRRQFCTFFVRDLFFGIDVLQVQEVIRYQEMTQVPLAPAEVGGLINLRGQIVTALEMRHVLGLPDRSPEEEPMNVVIRHDDEVISLLVDDIGDVIEVDDAAFEPPLDALPPRIRQLIRGVYKLDGQLLLVLNLEGLAEPA